MKNLLKTFSFLMLLMMSSLTFAQNTKEEAAIKAIIEKETEAWFNRDATQMLACWADVPQITQCVSLLGDVVIFNNADMNKDNRLFKELAKEAPIKASVARSDWNIRIVGNAAYVTFKQMDTIGGATNYYHEGRFMEKLNGQWKIVAVNVAAFKPAS
jgi:hypothetical protein